MQFWEYYVEDHDPFDFFVSRPLLRLVNKNEELAKQICSEAEKYYGVLQGIQEYSLGPGEKIRETEKIIISFSVEQIVIKDDYLYGFIRESEAGQMIDCFSARLWVIPISEVGKPVRTGKFYNEDGKYIGGKYYKYALTEYCTLMLYSNSRFSSSQNEA